MSNEQSIRDEVAMILATWRDGAAVEEWVVDMYREPADLILASPVIRRIQAEARAEGIRGAAEAVHVEARWQQEQVMRGAVQKSGAEAAVERLLVVETLLRQQAEYFERWETA